MYGFILMYETMDEMYIRIDQGIYARIYPRTIIHMDACTYVEMNGCMYVCMYISIYTCMYVTMYVYMYVCMYVEVYVSTCLCMYV